MKGNIMVISPTPKSTVIKLCTGIPFDSSYNDTMTFGSLAEQTSYFASKAVMSFSEFSYQRPTPGGGNTSTIRVPVLADKVYNVNYMMFQNTNFGMKWFYAFVTNVNYVNDSTTELTYLIDVMQTWKFDYTIKASYIEREHANTDAPGDNLVAENLELGEYVTEEPYQPWDMSALASTIVVAATFDKDLQPAHGQENNGIYSGLKFNGFDTGAEVNAFIENVVDHNKAEGIISIFMYPKILYTDPSIPIPEPTTHSTSLHKRNTQVGSYTPKNKKLLTYPYNFLFCTNGMGDSANYCYEYFGTDDCEFVMKSVLNCSSDALLMPAFYKYGETTDWQYKPYEGLRVSGFPQCAYTTDTYKVFLAQNAAQLPVSIAANAGSAIGNLITGNIGGVISNAVSVANTVAKVADTATLPNQAHGTQSPSTAFSYGSINFTFYNMHIREEYARIIDGYFNMYGYSTHRVKKPNVTGRKSWNYVKTIGAKNTGNLPSDDMAQVNSIFDAGITFWHNENVGDYTQDNSII